MYPIFFRFPNHKNASRIKLIWRPIFLLPHLFWISLYSSLILQAILINTVFTLVVGNPHRALRKYVFNYFRYTVQLTSYAMLITNLYPSFYVKDTQDDTIQVHISSPESCSRLTVVFRWLILLPHYLLGVGYSFIITGVIILNFFSVIISQKRSEYFTKEIKKYMIYSMRVLAYILLLTEDYPPFNGYQSLEYER